MSYLNTPPAIFRCGCSWWAHEHSQAEPGEIGTCKVCPACKAFEEAEGE